MPGELMNQLIGGRFKLEWKISSKVYLGVNEETGEKVAIKLESIKTRHPKLHSESGFYRTLRDGTGIPRRQWYGVQNGYRIMVIDLLGPSLEDLFNYCNRRFTLKTVLMLADEMIDIIADMHHKGFLHRDITPDHFLMGLERKVTWVYLIDFSLAKEYRDLQTHEHICYSYTYKRNLVGAPRYASLNTHDGVEKSRRDDLMLLGYVLMYFLRGSLPWQGFNADTDEELFNKIRKKKKNTSIEELCENYPTEFADYLFYCQSLEFEDKPDYCFLKGLFHDLFRREGYRYDKVFDWTMPQYSQVGSSSRSQPIATPYLIPGPSTGRVERRSRGQEAPFVIRTGSSLPRGLSLEISAAITAPPYLLWLLYQANNLFFGSR